MREMTRHSLTITLLSVMGLNALALAAADRGIEITPDEKNRFVYEDDFSTGRFLDEAFRDNLGASCWESGAIVHAGPDRRRTLTYRFYGTRRIEKLEVVVQQMANARHLGGVNTLYLSSNGLDWTQIVSTRDIEADSNGWASQPLTVSPEQAKPFLGKTEVWVRLLLTNHSGLKTNPSNRIDAIRVAMTLGVEASAGDDPQAAARARWGKRHGEAGHRSISLDWADPPEHRPLHYYEDADGWLRAPDAAPHMAIDEAEGFSIQRTYLGDQRSPLSLVAFMQGKADQPVMACIVVRGAKDSSRSLRVTAAGKTVATLDVASYFPTDRAFYVALPKLTDEGPCALRLGPRDSGRVLVRRISLTGPAEPRWVAKPPLASGGKLALVHAAYLPDPKPPADSQVVEGRPQPKVTALVFKGLQRFYKEHEDFGALRVVLRNCGSATLRIGDDLRLNGKPIEEAYVDFTKTGWDAPGVVWYRVAPRTLDPGECAEVYVRLRHRPKGERVMLSVPTSGPKPLEVAVPLERPKVIVDYVTTDASRKRLFVYVRKTSENAPNVASVALDGAPLTRVRSYGKGYPGNLLLLVAELDAPLALHSYHVVSVAPKTSDVPLAAARFRVLPHVFPRSSIHVPPELCDEMHMNLAMWRMHDEATCERFGLKTTAFESRVFDAHEHVAYIMGPDEPDAKDNRGGGYHRGLGYHARRLTHSGWQDLIARHAPWVATWLIMNGTTRPLNWCVYGQVADVSCFDPYPVTYYGADHAYVRESLGYARRCGAPRRMYACLEAYGWQKGQGVPKKARGPIPAEWRQNVVQAIGAGAKGLTSWVYVAMAGGWQLNEPVAQEIAKVNRLIAHIENELLLGTPIDIAASDAGLVPTGTVGNERWPKERVWVGALLCGPDAIALAAANHIPASKPEPPRITPAKDVTLTISLPPFLPTVIAFEATEDGLKPYPCDVAGGKARLKLSTIASGRVFVLRRKEN